MENFYSENRFFRVLHSFFIKKFKKKSDLFKQIVFQEMPITFKSDYNWYGQLIPKGSEGVIRAVDPVESLLLLDLILEDKAFRITSFIGDILPHLNFENKMDKKLLKSLPEELPWATIIDN